MTFTASKPKCVETNRGVSWATTIKFNGVVCAKVSNSGNGGCDDHEWVDRSYIDQFVAEVDKFIVASPDADLYKNFDQKDHRGQPGADRSSGYVESLMQAAEKQAAWDRDCKKHVMVQLPGKPVQMVKNKRPTPELVAQLRKQHPGIKILNPGFDKQ